MPFQRRTGYARGVLFATVILAALACTKPEPLTHPPYPALTFQPPIAPFTPLPVITRGSLNMIGYFTSPGPDGGLVATVYFWAPEVASRIPAGDPPPAACELAPNVHGAGTEHVTVDVELVWSPKTTASLGMNADCAADAPHQIRRSYVIGPVSASAKLFTPGSETPLPRLAKPPPA